MLGFLDYNLLLTLQLDHIYTAWYFYLSLGLLAASLSACTYTRQWPVVKVWGLDRNMIQRHQGSGLKANHAHSDPGVACSLPHSLHLYMPGLRG